MEQLCLCSSALLVVHEVFHCKTGRKLFVNGSTSIRTKTTSTYLGTILILVWYLTQDRLSLGLFLKSCGIYILSEAHHGITSDHIKPYAIVGQLSNGLLNLII